MNHLCCYATMSERKGMHSAAQHDDTDNTCRGPHQPKTTTLSMPQQYIHIGTTSCNTKPTPVNTGTVQYASGHYACIIANNIRASNPQAHRVYHALLPKRVASKKGNGCPLSDAHLAPFIQHAAVWFAPHMLHGPAMTASAGTLPCIYPVSRQTVSNKH